MWDLEIKASDRNTRLKFGEILACRELAFLFVKRDLSVTFKQTVLGPVWILLAPLLTAVLFAFVFGSVVGVSTNGIPTLLFYLVGVMTWNLFNDCFTATSRLFIGNRDLFTKIYFPRVIIAFSNALSAGVRFSVQLFLFIIFYLILFDVAGPMAMLKSIIIHLFVCLILIITATGMGLVVSSLTAKYRDLINVLPLISQVMMYLSAVVYPASTVPEGLGILILVNPLVPLFEAVRCGWFGCESIDLNIYLYPILFSMFVLVCGLILFRGTEKSAMDTA